MPKKKKSDKNKYKGKLFLIVGPSGVGKGSVIKDLKKLHPEFKYPISYTTRDPRPGEEDGVVYNFISRKEFEEKIEEGEILEYAIVHNKELYGTFKKPIIDGLKDGEIIIREVDMQGCESIQDILPRESVVSIFLTVSDEDELIDRIQKRGKLPKEEIERRMESAKKEFKRSGEICNYQVPNLTGKLDECVKEVNEIIEKEANLK